MKLIKGFFARFLLAMVAMMLMVTTFGAPACAAEAGPFGLTWGASLADIKAMGIKLEAVEGDVYQTKKLPDNLDWAANYCLQINKKQGLVRVIAYSQDILNDSSGELGKRFYLRLKNEVADKYALVDSSEKEPESSKNNSGFYMCLEGSDCGPWNSVFNQGDINVEITLEPLKKDAGYVSILYENRPLLAKIKEKEASKHKKKKKKKVQSE